MTERFKEGEGYRKDISICISEEMLFIFHLVEGKDRKYHGVCGKDIVILLKLYNSNVWSSTLQMKNGDEEFKLPKPI